jgi:hypothetical protein
LHTHSATKPNSCGCGRGWNTAPDAPVSVAMRKAFKLVGHVSRDERDLSYDRPLTVAPERLTQSRPI